jgi:hypothetical protein
VDASTVHEDYAYLLFYAKRCEVGTAVSSELVVTRSTSVQHKKRSQSVPGVNIVSDRPVATFPQASSFWSDYLPLLQHPESDLSVFALRERKVDCFLLKKIQLEKWSPRYDALRTELPVPASSIVDAALRYCGPGGVKLRRNVTKADARLLRNGEWLNDSILNDYLVLLSERHESILNMAKGLSIQNHDSLPQIFIFTPYFFTKLTKAEVGS